MARRRRVKSRTIQKAQIRAVAVEGFEPEFDLGNGVSITTLRDRIAEVQTLLGAYNAKLTEVDALYNNFLAKEKELETLNTRVLAGIGAKYGKDSNEYEQAGGTRTSEIRRKPRRSGTPEAGG